RSDRKPPQAFLPQPVYVAGTGHYLPGAPIPVEEIERVLGPLTDAPPKIRRWLETTAPVMRELLAIDYVHYAIDPVTRDFTDDNVTMATKAALAALAQAGVDAGEVDLLCYGSAHQDQMPTASVRIQAALGIEACAELSIHANCTSAYKALYLAHQLLRSGQYRCALVLSAGISSSELRAEYYNQALVDKESLYLRWFLGDGAGAVLLTTDESLSRGFEVEQTFIESVGGRREPLMYNLRPALWLNPKEEYERGLHHLRQGFRNALSTDVFQQGDGSIFFNGFKRMLARGGVPVEKIRAFQINMPAKHIVESVLEECEAFGIPRSVYWTKLDRLGYCGPPMALIGLDRILAEEAFEPDDRIVSFVTEVSKFMQAGYSIRCTRRSRPA
ncbi:MAG: 3-oxoacyl-ACP synthase, partial [Deltaproteobacteria bacterium]|nr:3-oxoacyl-ACP synthase [Deltaproteobacteria bacterium]